MAGQTGSIFPDFGHFFAFLVLKHFQKWSLNLQTILKNQYKATGFAMPPEVYVEIEIWM